MGIESGVGYNPEGEAIARCIRALERIKSKVGGPHKKEVLKEIEEALEEAQNVLSRN